MALESSDEVRCPEADDHLEHPEEYGQVSAGVAGDGQVTLGYRRPEGPYVHIDECGRHAYNFGRRVRNLAEEVGEIRRGEGGGGVVATSQD